MIVGIFAALFSPARAALLPTLIKDDQLVRANAMISGLGVIATMIAVAIGGKLADLYAFDISLAAGKSLGKTKRPHFIIGALGL